MPDYKQFLLADTAEGLTEAEILSWRVGIGDAVAVNQIVVEVETAKAAVELPCPWAGVVTELHGQVGDTMEVGKPLLTIDVDPGGAATANNGAAPTVPDEPEMQPLVGYGSKNVTAKRRRRKDTNGSVPTTTPEPVAAEPVAPVATASGTMPLAKPPVRKLAKDLGVDLRTLTGSAGGGVITRDDVELAAKPAAAPSPVSSSPRERRVAVKGVRKATAQAMVSSAFSAPHVTEFLSVDVTPMMELRARLKSNPAYADVKLTPLAFAAKAVCLAVRRTPDVNAMWDEQTQEIVYKDFVHLGIAAATPRGLVVPKVRDADQLSLPELASAIGTLTETARAGKTPPAELVDGTITITNVGVFGVDTGTPIINPGEAAILAFGAIRDMPWVVDGELAVRKVLQLSLSFDHRIVDGQQGSRFLADVGALLADPAVAITF